MTVISDRTGVAGASRILPAFTVDEFSRAMLLDHCREMFGSLSRAEQRRAGAVYVAGLLDGTGRRSVRRIAQDADGDVSDQSLQQFVHASAWDPAPVRQHLAGWACARVRPRGWVVDEVVFRKHGHHSAGVERQYARGLGRIVNCQVGVYAALATADLALPVTWRLALPRSWDDDAQRRRKARIPPHVRHQPLWRYQLAVLDDLFGDWGAPVAPVVLDARQSWSGGEPLFELADRGLEFLAQVNGAVADRLIGSRRVGGDRRAGSVSPSGACGALSTAERQTAVWHDPTTGRQLRAHFSCVRVRSSALGEPGRRGARRSWNVLVEWGLGKHRPRAFWVTNLVDRPLPELVGLTRLSPRAHADLAEMGEGLGLTDYEGRSYLGWHHHVTLASIAFALRRVGLGPVQQDPVPHEPPRGA